MHVLQMACIVSKVITIPLNALRSSVAWLRGNVMMVQQDGKSDGNCTPYDYFSANVSISSTMPYSMASRTLMK